MFSKRKAKFQGADEAVDVEVLPARPDKTKPSSPASGQAPTANQKEAIIEKKEAVMKKAEPKPVAAQVADTGGDKTTADLERLRDILYGSQSRHTDKRLSDLEQQVTAVRQELTDLLTSGLDRVAQNAGSQLDTSNRTLNDRLTNLAAEQTSQLRSTRQSLDEKIEAQNAELTSQINSGRRELNERIDKSQAEQSTQLREVQRELNQQLETTTADFFKQLRQMQKELSERLEQINSAQTQRLQTLQEESRRRDDSLRQELLLLASRLEDGKVSRQDLGQMLMEMGRGLQE